MKVSLSRADMGTGMDGLDAIRVQHRASSEELAKLSNLWTKATQHIRRKVGAGHVMQIRIDTCTGMHLTASVTR